MTHAGTVAIAKALNGESAGLDSEQWGEMYQQLWERYDEALMEIEYLRTQFLLYASTRWPN